MSSRAAQKSKLEELRNLRNSKKTRLSSYRTQDEQQLFDELDEEDYKKVQRSRLDQDDFVVDDNGEGYVENGLDEWEAGRDAHGYSSSDDNNDTTPAKGKGKRKREVEKAIRKDQEGSINKYFTSMAVQSAAKHKVQSTSEDKDFLNDLLGQLDESQDSFRSTKKLKAQNVEPVPKKHRALSPSRNTRDAPPKVKEEPLNSDADIFMPSSPPRHGPVKGFDSDDEPSGETRTEMLASEPPTGNRIKNSKNPLFKKDPDLDEQDEDDELAVRPILTFSKARDSPVNLNAVRPDLTTNMKPVTPKGSTTAEAIDARQWKDVNASLSNFNSSQTSEQPILGKLAAKDVLDGDGSLRFFWIDYTEIGGCLCLFGKVYKHLFRYIG
ncbi:hypothetical protein ABW19_dt0201600 [Dactylella cylindrospora]|nr:hypothetical protein ABW19_dt0201600 [Dactylella cylindrospora]